MPIPRTAFRRALLATLSVVAMVAASTLIAAPARAASFDGVCESGEFCLYYNSGNQGSLRDFPGSISNYGEGTGCHRFISAGPGQGECVKNNAASAWNRQASYVTVFYKSGYAGAIDNFSPGSKADLRPALKNENAGHLVGSTLNTTLSTGLYKNADARITAYFDGYLSQSGRHEGTDVARYSGAPVYALVSGTVTRVVEGSTGSLSSLAIYHSFLNKTVIYLHLDPLSFSVGQSIGEGQHIGYEDNRAGGSPHTHVEMRLGRQTHAAVSVDDPVLDNPNPTSFWMTEGYNICCQFS